MSACGFYGSQAVLRRPASNSRRDLPASSPDSPTSARTSQVLEQSDLIRTEKVGRVRTCTIAPGGLDIAEQWLQGRRALTERRLDRLGALLAQEHGAAPAEMGEDEQ